MSTHRLCVLSSLVLLAGCGGGDPDPGLPDAGGGARVDAAPGTPDATPSAPDATGLAPPGAPSGLSASATSSATMTLAWLDNATNETGFRIERALAAAGPFTLITSVGAGATGYGDAGLSASTTYYYRVVAFNAAGNSGFSNTASAMTPAPPVVVPAAPSGVVATATSSSSISLTWSDNASNEASYRVQRGTSAGLLSDLATLGANATSYTSTGLGASTTYYYRVYAVNSAGNSGFSNTANATTPAPPVVVPAAPSNLVATALSTSSISLTWNDNANNETSYRVQRGVSASILSDIATLSAGATSYTNTGLAASSTYYYRVYAVNSAGNSGFSNTANATTQAGVMTLTVNPQNDNLIMRNSQNAATANTVFASNDLAVGCNWLYSPLTGIQDSVCASSLLRFNVQTQISGKTILQARLRLYVYALPGSYTTNYKLWAVFNSWSGSTVTWTNQPQIYTASGITLAQPISGSIPYDINVTGIVQNWANGTWTNNGFLFEDTSFLFPYDTLYRATGFCSNEYNSACGGLGARPQLYIQYQ